MKYYHAVKFFLYKVCDFINKVSIHQSVFVYEFGKSVVILFLLIAIHGFLVTK